MVHVIVTYDIVSDRRRARVCRALKGALQRVQKSVFEGDVTPRRLQSVRGTLLKLIDAETDSVRLYQVCARCVPAVEVLGAGVYVDSPDDDVVV